MAESGKDALRVYSDATLKLEFHGSCESSEEGNRRVEHHYCGCEQFRVIYTHRGWAGKLIRGRERRYCRKPMTTSDRPIRA